MSDITFYREMRRNLRQNFQQRNGTTVAKVKDLRMSGKTYREISDELGISISYVGTICTRFGVTKVVKQVRADVTWQPRNDLGRYVPVTRSAEPTP